MRQTNYFEKATENKGIYNYVSDATNASKFHENIYKIKENFKSSFVTGLLRTMDNI